ncbi:hypothetical protein [Bacillus sp. ISL-7]|uniref:hypothetical protein n=1 Tax=Bacillus sp. ISL-7 TaxID=2819136 RepID=UPI0035A8C8DB
MEPGDVLDTGSPSGSCPMKSDDIVSVEVENIGKLCNYGFYSFLTNSKRKKNKRKEVERIEL